jgi:diguanylate cyclase (GGDEF)-like protein
MADREDLDITALRKQILGEDLSGGGLAPGTSFDELAVDPVTGLLPRALWEAGMKNYYEHARRTNESFVVALMDLDKFKEVNDTLGHQAGDELLGKFGQAVLERFRAADIKGRYGGDEVIVMMTGSNLAEHQLEKEEKDIAEELKEKCGRAVSVGMAKWDGTESVDDLIKKADQRLYQNKKT